MDENKNIYDTIIIGSGPSFAIELRTGKPALLFSIEL